jgi:hypothetical protein
VVVVFPSPSGVGVTAVTTTYFRLRHVGQLVDRRQLDLHHALPVRLQQVRADAHVAGDIIKRLEQRRHVGAAQVQLADRVTSMMPARSRTLAASAAGSP